MTTAFHLNEKTGTYTVNGELTEMHILEMANQIARNKLSKGVALTSPNAVRLELRHLYQSLEYEVFVGVFLDSQNRIIETEELARGTIDSASIYPREVVRAALKHNARSVIFAHNHPSGVAEPSSSDRAITRKLTDALDLVGTKVLDHFVVGTEDTVSFSERGWI